MHESLRRRYPVRYYARPSIVNLFWLVLLPAAFAADSVPRLSTIDYYGLRRVSENRIQKALGVSAGDPMPPSKGAIEERLEKIPGVVVARLEAVCCDGPRGMLFVGIEEKGAAHFALHSPPTGDAKLPQDMVNAYSDLLRAVESAARRGSTAEDLTQGHPLMADPDARAIQEGFQDFASNNLEEIRNVLRSSADGDERTMAAAIIGYARDKGRVINDLEYAMQDPDENVRSSAMTALNAMAVLAAKEPQRGIHISPTWLVEMLNSIVLSDRTHATMVLINLTDSRPPETLALLRERALNSLVEMAQWNSLRYALPAFVLLGRVGGLSEEQIQESWAKGERTAVILEVVGSKKKKHR
jgi:hypothetical protein